VRRRMANSFSAPTNRRGIMLGDKVEFETPRGDIVSGTCVKKGDLIFAVPEGKHRKLRVQSKN
jgi:hypothetical protein